MLRLVSAEQCWKADSPMQVTESGSSTRLNAVHSAKVARQISLTEPWTVTTCKALHQRKASAPILVTDFGSDAYVKDKQRLKAPGPISMTELGIEISVSETQLSNALSAILIKRSGNVTCLNKRQPVSAATPISVRDAGSVKEVNEDSWKADFPKLVTESGIVKDVKDLHFSNADGPISMRDALRRTLFKRMQDRKALAPISITEFGMITFATASQLSKAMLGMRVTSDTSTQTKGPTSKLRPASSCVEHWTHRQLNSR